MLREPEFALEAALEQELEKGYKAGLEPEEQATELEPLFNRKEAATALQAGVPVRSGSDSQPIRTLDKFESRHARLRPFHLPPINDVADRIVASWRQGTPIRTIRLVSHTDNTGRAPYDITLGSSRALAVQRALTAAIDRLRPGLGRRIRFVRRSLGSKQPFTTNETAQGRALNRRVEIFPHTTLLVSLETDPFAIEQQLASGTGERFIEAALNGNNGTEAYFFLADHYVTYSWANDRASDGVRPVSGWGIPPSIVGPGPGSGLDAALNGKRAYIDKAYFFKGSSYARVKFAGRVLETPDPPSISTAWGFPAQFASDIDAAFNGRFSREGKAFFFKADQYLRYRWGDASGRGAGVDPRYPRAMRNLRGMPTDFARGVDAAVDGDGAWARFGYLFRQGQYIRMNWNPSGGEPHIDGPAANIQERWPGLVELLVAGKAKARALEWVGRARLELLDYASFLSGTWTYPNQAVMETALLAHFRLDPSMLPAPKAPLVAQIMKTYISIENTLNNSPTIFRYRTDAETVAERGQPKIPPAYTNVQTGTINFTRKFPTYGPLARAAMALHESVHVFDNQSYSANTHIPEWYVTDTEATRLGLPTKPNDANFPRRYDEMPTSDKLHNPSSFTAFAQHIRYGSDTRYGAAKPNQ